MSVPSEIVAESEPPSPALLADARCATLVDRVWAVAHLTPSAHVAVIGRRALPLVLELLHRGCQAVRTQRPGSPAPDCESADLVWIADIADAKLDEALCAARARAGHTGRVIVEGATRLTHIRERAAARGLDVVAFDHDAARLVLAIAGRPALAA